MFIRIILTQLSLFKPLFQKYQLKRHQETHDSIFYACPYCEKPPVKARSSLKKHLSQVHTDKITEWGTSSFLTKQIVRDEEKLRELRKKYLEKKRLNGSDKYAELCRVVSEETTSNSITSGGGDSLDSSMDDLTMTIDNNNSLKRANSVPANGSDTESKRTVKKVIQRMVSVPLTLDDAARAMPHPPHPATQPNIQRHHQKYIANAVLASDYNKRQKFMNGNVEMMAQNYYAAAASVPMPAAAGHGGPSQPKSAEDHEMIDNLFFDKLISENLLDPLNGSDYQGTDDDHSINSVNYIQETFQNSFDKIQEKLDAELEVDSDQLKWADTLKSDDSTDEMSGKLLGIDESVMLI